MSAGPRTGKSFLICYAALDVAFEKLGKKVYTYFSVNVLELHRIFEKNYDKSKFKLQTHPWIHGIAIKISQR